MDAFLSGKKILVILTNKHELTRSASEPQRRTGFDVKELAYLYTCIHKKYENLQFVFATPSGGEAPIDPESEKHAENDEVVKKFLQNHNVLNKIKNTEKITQMRAEEFGAVFIPGGPGCMLDLPETMRSNGKLICKVYENRGIIAAIGHGVSALLNVTKEEHTEGTDYWIKGKKVTAISKEEDRKMGLDKSLPFMLEEKLHERGARYEKRQPFESFVVVDGHLITGQNPASSREWVTKIMEVCGHRE